MCCWFNHHFGLLDWTAFQLVMHLRSCVPFPTEYTYTHSSQTICVRTSHAPSLTHYSDHTLATDIVILLASVRHRGQGIAIWTTAGTPTPNGLRSNWDFLQGDPLTCWQVQHHQHFGARRRAKWQAESSHLFWISIHLALSECMFMGTISLS